MNIKNVKMNWKRILSTFCCMILFAGITVITSGVTVVKAATVGQVLTYPENGWQRINHTDKKIFYLGAGWVDNGPDELTTNFTGASIEIKFYGTKIRVLGYSFSNRCNQEITVDGKSYGIYTNGAGTEGSDNTLIKEVTGLTLQNHTVVITPVVSGYTFFGIDGIDIDSTGYIVDQTVIQATVITLNKTTDTINVGETDPLTATITPSTATNQTVKWTSSDTTIATVDPTTGIVTAGNKAGTATITATTTDGSNLSAPCVVTVPDSSTTTPPDGTSTIVNIAHAKGDNTNNAGGEVSIIFNGVPDATLSVVKTANVKSVWVGDTFTYTIVVKNTGSKTAKAVVINDSAPNHIQFMPSGITTTQGTVDSSSTSSNIIVNVGDIPPSGTVTITVPATVVL